MSGEMDWQKAGINTALLKRWRGTHRLMQGQVGGYAFNLAVG